MRQHAHHNLAPRPGVRRRTQRSNTAQLRLAHSERHRQHAQFFGRSRGRIPSNPSPIDPVKQNVHNPESGTVHRIRRGKRRLPNRQQQQRLCRRGMGRPSSQESLHLHDILRPLLVPLNPRSKLEPSESNIQRCVSHAHDRVLRNLATTRALSQLHIQPIFAPNRTDRLVHRLSFRRNPTLQLFLELR